MSTDVQTDVSQENEDRGDLLDQALDTDDGKAGEKDESTEGADEPGKQDGDDAGKTGEGEEGDEDSGEEQDTAGKFIPKSRFDEAVQRERAARSAAEERLRSLEEEVGKREPGADPVVEKLKDLDKTIDALDDKLVEAQVEGNRTAIKHLNVQIRTLERERNLLQTDVLSNTRAAQQVALRDYQLEAARLEAENAFYNPQSEDYDENLVEYTLWQRDKFIKQGLPPAEALAEAAKVASTWKKPPAEAERGLGAGVAKARKEVQVSKNLDTARRQPANLAGVGKDSSEVTSADKLSDEEFEKLPESTKARLRGDTF
jgi:hypothetical protein